MEKLLQIVLTLPAIFVSQVCHGSPVGFIPYADHIQQTDVVNTFLNYLTSNSNLSITTKHKGDHSGSCPWKYVTNHDVNRFPVSIVFAEVTVNDNRCLEAPGNFKFDYFCEYITKTANVLTKKCAFCPYQKQVINVPVGSRCVERLRVSNYHGQG